MTIAFSLSGAVAFAQVAGPEQQLIIYDQTQGLEAEDIAEDILLAEEEALSDKQQEIEELYLEEQLQTDFKVVSKKYNDFNFDNIGTLSAKDVQIGISTANSFVNIRESADPESEVLGKLYNNKAAAVLSIENEWAQVESGSVKGYISTEYLNTNLTKDQAIDNHGKVRATSTVDALNVRTEPNTESDVITGVSTNDNNTLLEVLDDWVKISVSKSDVEGYVSSEYVDLSVSFEQAISIEEEQEIIRKQEEAKKKAAEEAAKKKAAAQTSISTNSAKEEIARRESGGSYNAVSKSGTYIGRYQLHKSYLNGDHSPANQERVVENYVASRYGSWQKALSFWNANGWY